VAWQSPQLKMTSGSVKLCVDEESLVGSTGAIAMMRPCRGRRLDVETKF
jgi:hypothetical protein